MFDSSLIELSSRTLHVQDLKLVAFNENIFFKHGVVTATLAVLVYDYLCTLDREASVISYKEIVLQDLQSFSPQVALVWIRPRTIATYLFVLNRYLPFVEITMSLYALKVMLSPEGCHRQYSAITYLNTVGVLLTHVILIQRTIAIWQKNIWICSILAIVITGTAVSSFVTAKLFLDSLKFGEANPDFFYGCVLLSSNSMIKVNFINVLIAETTIVVLTLIRAVTHLRHSRSSWTHRMYRAGFLFYIFIFAITLLNTLFPGLSSSPSLKTIFTDPQIALHSMLCNRVVFTIFDHQGFSDSRESGAHTSSRRAGGDPESAIIFTTILETMTPDVDRNDSSEIEMKSRGDVQGGSNA